MSNDSSNSVCQDCYDEGADYGEDCEDCGEFVGEGEIHRCLTLSPITVEVKQLSAETLEEFGIEEKLSMFHKRQAD